MPQLTFTLLLERYNGCRCYIGWSCLHTVVIYDPYDHIQLIEWSRDCRNAVYIVIQHGV